MTTLSTQSQILREIDSLRKTVAHLQAALDRRNRITLHSARPTAFLGQPRTIVARVTDSGGGAPRANVPVTFVTMWGRLRGTGNLAGLYSNSVTVRTGADGTARVTHHSPVSENLTQTQQGALEAALGVLDRDARTPQEVEAGLHQIAESYQRDIAANLRSAVDSYFLELGQSFTESLRSYNHLLAWSYCNAPVLACVNESPVAAEDETSTQVSAMLTLHFKNWLGPWLQVYMDLAGEKSDLDQALEGVKQQGGDEMSLTEGIYTQIQDFIFSQRGRVGEYLGSRIAEDSVRRFMSSNLDELPLDTRVGLRDALGNVPRTIAASGAGGIAALGQARADLDRATTRRFATNQGVTTAIDTAFSSRDLATQADVTGTVDGGFASRDLVSSGDVTNAIDSAFSSRDLATQADVTGAVDGAFASRDLVSSGDVTRAIDSAFSSRDLATSADVTRAVDGAFASRDLVSSGDVTNAISTATRNLLTQDTVSSMISGATRDLVTSAGMASAINSAFTSRSVVTQRELTAAINNATSNLLTRDSFTTEINRLDDSVTRVGNSTLATRTDLFRLSTGS